MDDVSRTRVAGYLLGQGCLFAALALPDRSVGGEQGKAPRRPGRGARAAGLVLMTGGAGLAAWGAAGLGRHLQASPTARPGAAVRTGGAYGVVRHPIYAGLLLGAAGRALRSGGRRHRLAALGLAALLHSKARYEEQLLQAAHPDYAAYAARVPRLLPRCRRAHRPRRTEGPAQSTGRPALLRVQRAGPPRS